MHEFFAKIARHAFSKGAAFCYAVTVGVSGQLAYNYLQPRAPTPVAVAMPAALPAPASGAALSGVIAVAPIPGATPPETAPLPGRHAAPASLAGLPAHPAKPASPAPVTTAPVTTAPILPEPPSPSLPSPAALPAPEARSAPPPSRHPAAAAPGIAPGIAPGATPGTAATATAATMVEPSPAPVEPAEKPLVSVTVKPAPPADMPPPHPRAAEIARPAGDRDASVAAPIPLLPSAGAAETEKAALPVAPGPGSGGLY